MRHCNIVEPAHPCCSLRMPECPFLTAFPSWCSLMWPQKNASERQASPLWPKLYNTCFSQRYVKMHFLWNLHSSVILGLSKSPSWCFTASKPVRMHHRLGFRGEDSNTPFFANILSLVLFNLSVGPNLLAVTKGSFFENTEKLCSNLYLGKENTQKIGITLFWP